MTSNIQFVSEFAGSIPVASAPGKVRLFRDVADGLLKFKDNLGAIYPIAGTQDYKDAVRFASSAALPAYTRVGNTITASANGALPIQDGVTPALNDSFLYINGTGITEKDNGIWVVTQLGDGSNPFILDRRGDFAASSQVSPGLVVPTGPEGGSNASKLFILATPAPIILNSTAITFEAISGGGGFSLTEVDAAVSVPEKQAMLYSDDVVIVDDGDLNLDGDVTPVRSEDNFSVNYIPARSVRVVQENDQMLFTDSMEVDGDLIVDGDILDATPYDGNDILAALTAIAPLTPSILGVSSPVGFKTPLEARTIMDVPSNAEMTAAIAASSGGCQWAPGVQNANFSAVAGTAYIWDCNLTLVATLPAAPADNTQVLFSGDGTGGVAGSLTLNAGANTFVFSAGPSSLPIPGPLGPVPVGLQFRQTGGPGVGFWGLTNLDFVSYGLAGNGPNSLPISDNTNVIQAITIADESVVGRTGGGSLSSILISSLGGGSLPFTTTVYNSANPVEVSKINRYAGNTSFNFTLPTNPPDGTVVGFMADPASGIGGSPTATAGGANTVWFGGAVFPLAPRTATLGSYITLRFDAQTAPGVWRPILDTTIWGLGTVANQLLTTNTSSNPVGAVISDDSFVGRTGGGSIGTLSPTQALALLYPNQTIVNASVNTTGNTPTTITSYVTANDFAVITFDLLIQAQSNNNNDVAVFKMVGVCHRASGGASVTSKDLTFVNGPYRDAGAAAWAVTFNISGGGPTIDVQVTGDAAEDIDWRVTGSISEHS